ncbi:MAG: hypothetical protein OXC98_11955 [bacterium]|nr:hypothetical protein [Acidimicrobiia bacterium]MCY4651066.1 hypothetical protein [bacterium]
MAVDIKDKYRKVVLRGKYRRLYVGFELPQSARLHRPWWGNQRGGNGHSQALAWSAAGWETAEVDMDGETLLFRRTQPDLPPRLMLDEAWPTPPRCGRRG